MARYRGLFIARIRHWWSLIWLFFLLGLLETTNKTARNSEIHAPLGVNWLILTADEKSWRYFSEALRRRNSYTIENVCFDTKL